MQNRTIWIALISLLSFSGSAWGYSISIHNQLPDAIAGESSAQQKAALPDDKGLNRFRAQFYDLAMQTEDPALRARFLARYPTVADFTPEAFKEFFGMAATHPALAFDPYDQVIATAVKKDPHAPIVPNAERTLVDWVRIGSIYPDLDLRNRGRWLVQNGQIVTARDGERVPFDPVILNMGRVESLSGQAHAHYGLNRNPKSEDSDVLKNRPADFAVPVGFPEGPVLTFAPERAQAYGDLALIAQEFNEPALAAVFVGNAYHYLGDVGNQLHTIQVGIYDFFVDATLQSWKMKFLRLGGLLGEVPAFKSIGIDIITNHHTWSEEMFRIAVERAREGKPIHPSLSDPSVLFRTNAKLMAEWSTLPTEGPRLRQLSNRIILAGNVEGAEIYALTRELTVSDLRKAGVKKDFELEPDSAVLASLKENPNPEKLARFFHLQKMGTIRASTAMNLWWKTHWTATRPPIRPVMDRLLRQQLSELDAAESRRSVWLKGHGGIAGR